MARTRASVGAKLASGKSSKAKPSAPPPPPPPSQRGAGSSNAERSSRSSGGNSVCPRDTPKWQKPISNFFVLKETNGVKSHNESDAEDEAVAGNSKTKRNIIDSDSEQEESDKPKNKALDETIELEPLNGDDSHKIEEYYPKNESKNKGKGKRSKGKENRVAEKREREDNEEEQAIKRAKVSDD